jgi:hypothetical protein
MGSFENEGIRKIVGRSSKLKAGFARHCSNTSLKRQNIFTFRRRTGLIAEFLAIQFIKHPFVGAMNPGKEMGPNPLRNQDPQNDGLF